MTWFRALLQQDSHNRVLAITSNHLDHAALESMAARERWDLKFASGWDAALALLKQQRPALVVCDCDLPGMEWRAMLGTLKELAPSSAIVMIAPETDDRFWQEVLE